MNTTSPSPLRLSSLGLLLLILLSHSPFLHRASAAETNDEMPPIDIPQTLDKAEHGDAFAQLSLGMAYLYGKGAEEDDKKAVTWIHQAALQNVPLAQLMLGVLYSGGKGVPQNYNEAFKWTQKAAAQGLPMAQRNLGKMYARGRGVPKNDAEAVKWWQKGAEQGDARSQTLSLGSYITKESCCRKAILKLYSGGARPLIRATLTRRRF